MSHLSAGYLKLVNMGIIMGLPRVARAGSPNVFAYITLLMFYGPEKVI